jgi:hypothetical protein
VVEQDVRALSQQPHRLEIGLRRLLVAQMTHHQRAQVASGLDHGLAPAARLEAHAATVAQRRRQTLRTELLQHDHAVGVDE